MSVQPSTFFPPELQARILVAIRDLRTRDLSRRYEATQPLPYVPQVPQEPQTPEQQPYVPEQPEPTRYPIHPEIPTQPIHEPVREPDHTPVEGP